jgi:hypothetical protein
MGTHRPIRARHRSQSVADFADTAAKYLPYCIVSELSRAGGGEVPNWLICHRSALGGAASGLLRDPGVRAEPGALRDAAARHHCYEVHIGFTHLGWNVWTRDQAALAATARRLAEVLERGPLPQRGPWPAAEGRAGPAAGLAAANHQGRQGPVRITVPWQTPRRHPDRAISYRHHEEIASKHGPSVYARAPAGACLRGGLIRAWPETQRR